MKEENQNMKDFPNLWNPQFNDGTNANLNKGKKNEVRF